MDFFDQLSPQTAKAWGIADALLIADTHTSRIFRVNIVNGGSAILKCLKPEGSGERPGIDFLQWREGHGAVRVIAREGDCALLEDAGNLLLRTFHQDNGDEVATRIILSVLPELHAPSRLDPPSTLVPMERHFRELFLLAEGARNHRDLSRWAADVARGLLAESPIGKPLHGDLHHDNVIGDGSGSWKAIDPQGIVGDPVYDVANVFGNPLGAGDLIVDPRRIMRLAQIFATFFDCAPAKVLRYAGAHAMLSVAWSLDRPGDAASEENIRERAAFAHLVRSLITEQYV